jgi:hypothetical protein
MNVRVIPCFENRRGWCYLAPWIETEAWLIHLVRSAAAVTAIRSVPIMRSWTGSVAPTDSGYNTLSIPPGAPCCPSITLFVHSGNPGSSVLIWISKRPLRQRQSALLFEVVHIPSWRSKRNVANYESPMSEAEDPVPKRRSPAHLFCRGQRLAAVAHGCREYAKLPAELKSGGVYIRVNATCIEWYVRPSSIRWELILKHAV